LKEQSKNQKPKTKIPVCLTIAGLDPSGGAGIVADIKTFSAFGCFAAAAVASITFQNTSGVFGAVHQTAETLRRQVEPIVEDYKIAALKTGMLPTAETIEETARIVKENRLKNFVVDPVVRSTSGFDLITDDALKILIEKLFPLSEIVTPNLPEAERIANLKIKNTDDIKEAAKIMHDFGAKNVLIKGGHFFEGEREKAKGESENRKAKDYLFGSGGDNRHVFESDFIETNATHGTGCTLAAAIAANLALGKSLYESIETAKRFVTEAIRTAPDLGRGHSPINHLLKSF
jgi:hydroxymethylpyrimidine/phosphomethylpyrimidine kinase